MMNWFKKRGAKAKSAPVLLPIVYVHESVLVSSEKYLRHFVGGVSLHEQVIYWAGKRYEDGCIITTVIAPRAATTRGSFHTSALDNATVIGYLADTNLELLAQVHSHPGKYVDHSEGDNEGALMPFEGFFSIVVPEYCQTGILPLTKCGIHRFENSCFRRLRNKEIGQTFRMIPLFKQMQ